MGDVYGHLYSGKTPSRKNSTNFGGDTPWIRTTDLNNGLIKSATEFLTYEGIRQLKILPENTIVLAMYGGFNQIGRTGILGFPATINQALVALTPQKNINQVFAQSYLNRHIIDWRRVAASSRKDPNITKEDVEKSDFSFGSLEEQNRISKLISRLDHTITLHEEKKRQLGRLKNALLQKMFADKSGYPAVRFEGFDEVWKHQKFRDIVKGLQNNTFSRSELNYECGTVKNIHYGDILTKFGEFIDASKTSLPYISDDTKADKFEKSFLKDGDIVIADTAEDDTVGKCVEIQGSEHLKTIAGLHTIACRPKQKYGSKYLGYYLNSPVYHNQLRPLMQGIKVTSISKSALQNTDFEMPQSVAEQAKIGDVLSKIDSLNSLNQREVKKLSIIKQSLLQKMFI